MLVRAITLAALAVAGTTLAACGSFSRVNSAGGASAAPVKVIAMMPGGLMADAVAVELANRGFTIVDGSSTTRLVRRENAREIESVQPDTLAALSAKGVDAVVQVRAVMDRRGNPVNASARMTSVRDSAVMAAVNWQNGHGNFRKETTDAAKDIAKELAARVNPAQ